MTVPYRMNKNTRTILYRASSKAYILVISDIDYCHRLKVVSVLVSLSSVSTLWLNRVDNGCQDQEIVHNLNQCVIIIIIINSQIPCVTNDILYLHSTIECSNRYICTRTPQIVMAFSHVLTNTHVFISVSKKLANVKPLRALTQDDFLGHATQVERQSPPSTSTQWRHLLNAMIKFMETAKIRREIWANVSQPSDVRSSSGFH